jgi:hypothetical protein
VLLSKDHDERIASIWLRIAAMYYYPSVSSRAATIHRDIVGCGLCSDVGQVVNLRPIVNPMSLVFREQDEKQCIKELL